MANYDILKEYESHKEELPNYDEYKCLQKMYDEYKKVVKELLTALSKNCSKEEQTIYDILSSKYTVYKEYVSQRYPFNCDYYIPEIDTYIEYQGHWTHNHEPYTGTKLQKQMFNMLLQNNDEKSYSIAYTWSVRDVVKRQWAKYNKLKWLEFYDVKSFKQWFAKI